MRYIFRYPVMFQSQLQRRGGEKKKKKHDLSPKIQDITHTEAGLKYLSKSHCFSAGTMALFRKETLCPYFVLVFGNNQFREGGSYISVVHTSPALSFNDLLF